MMRNILFDVDGVLINGYHAKPELCHYWDENIEHDLGIDRQHFKDNFIFKDFVSKVIVGKKDLFDALESYLPAANFNDDPQIVIDYWMENDAKVNHELIAEIKRIKQKGTDNLFIATNQEKTRANYLMKNVGFSEYFSDIFYAGKIGFLKPSDRYFQFIEDNLPKSEYKPVLFDDTQAIIDFANNRGWEAYQFDGVEDLNKCEYIKDILSND
jgi:putative hydrolase of the HAD superfamily